MNLIEHIEHELRTHNNKISTKFINSLANHPETKVVHHQMTPCTRVCVVILPSGHELLGYAQVLDAANDIELIGQEVAYKDAIEKLWELCGGIAKAIL